MPCCLLCEAMQLLKEYSDRSQWINGISVISMAT